MPGDSDGRGNRPEAGAARPVTADGVADRFLLSLLQAWRNRAAMSVGAVAID